MNHDDDSNNNKYLNFCLNNIIPPLILPEILPEILINSINSITEITIGYTDNDKEGYYIRLLSLILVFIYKLWTGGF